MLTEKIFAFKIISLIKIKTKSPKQMSLFRGINKSVNEFK